MTDSPLIPGSHSRPIAPTGQFAGEWYRFFRDLIRYVQETEGNTAELAALEARVAALEAAGQNPLTLLGPFSVQVLGSLLDGSATVQLVNDESNPGAWRFYATDESGGKAWLPLYPNVVPNPYADYLTDPDGNYLTDPDGNFLMSQDGFPIPLEYGGTGADNSSVAANLVWASPDGMAGAPVFRALVGDDVPDHNDTNGLQGGNATERYHFTAAEHTELQVLTAGGTTGQFWRGDGAWSNTLLGSFGIGMTPDRPLTVSTSGNPLAAGNASFIVQGDANKERMEMRSSGGDPTYQAKRSGGTSGTPTATSSGEVIGQYAASGHDGTDWVAGNRALVRMKATQNWTPTAQGVELVFMTNPNGSAAIGVERWAVRNSGSLEPAADATYPIGSASFRVSQTFTRDLILGLQAASLGGGVGVAFISNATTVPTTNPANGGILYVSGGALFYRGSAGTVTPLAPA